MYPIICQTEVPFSELEDLKKQAAELQRRIDALTKPTSLARLCKEEPYNLPCFLERDARNPVTFDRLPNTDAWSHFLALGKSIHEKNGLFVQRGRKYPNAYFYVDEHEKRIPKKLSELSKEEMEISAEMLDKMIAIYNEYMVRLHTHVFLRDDRGEVRTVPVQAKPEKEGK